MVVVAFLSGLLLTVSPAAHADSDKPTLLGMASGDEWRADLDVVESATGRYPAIYQMFRPIDGLGTVANHDWTSTVKSSIRVRTQAWFTDIHERGMVPYLEVQVRSRSAFHQLLSGGLDGQLQGFVTTIGEWLAEDSSRRILITPFPEANNKKHPWGGDPEDYKKAYHLIRDAITAVASPGQVRFIFGINGLADLDYEAHLNGYAGFYPGDGSVDLVGFAKLNRGEPQWRDYDRTFTLHITEMQETVTRTKPILIIQTGSIASGDNGESRSDWLADMFTGLENHPQVIGAIYFNRNKADGAGTNEVFDYRLVANGVVDSTLRNLYPSWSPPSEAEWIFDGRMDQWVANREAATEAGFRDTIDSVFAADIAWLGASGITRGCNPPVNDRFCPDDPVTRGQMAAFLVRALGVANPGGEDFVDDDSSTFENDIEALAAAGITRGCDPPVNDWFCPDDPVTRGQMAAFLVRALGLANPGGEDFVDDDSSTFENDIEALAAAGITRGCNPPVNDRFCPDDPVTRGQMAAFLHRADTLIH
jgi:hypothetical protein